MTQQPSSAVPELTLGWRLKMALEHNQVSRSEMAAELGVDPATITRWTGDRGAPPKAGFLKQWALRCGVPYAWLLTGEVAQSDLMDGTGRYLMSDRARLDAQLGARFPGHPESRISSELPGFRRSA